MPKKYDYKRATFYYEGKQYECTGKTQKEADKKAALKEESLKRGEIGISDQMTVKRWAYEWLETYKKDKIQQSTYNDTKRRIDKMIIPEIGNVRLRDVKDIQLQKMLNSRTGMSKSEVEKSTDLIKAIFKRARMSRLIVHDPAESLLVPRYHEGTHRSITDLERSHILTVAETHKAGLWVLIMLYCGLRPAETSALTWRDIDFAERTMKVSASMDNLTNELKETKTAAGVREIPIPDVLLQKLEKYYTNPLEPILVQESTGNRHTMQSRKRLWENFIKALDISMGAVYEKRLAKDGKMRSTLILSVVAEDLTPYCLRHTYCTDLQDAGVPINIAAYLMGHANIAVTSKIYTHTTKTSLQSAAQKINAFANNGKNDGKLLESQNS